MPVLDKVSGHILVVEQQHGEMKLAVRVFSDGLLHDLGHVELLLAQFDLLGPQVAVDC